MPNLNHAPSKGVQSGLMVDRVRETLMFWIIQKCGVGPVHAEVVANSMIDALENDLRAGRCRELHNLVWNQTMESNAGAPGTRLSYNQVASALTPISSVFFQGGSSSASPAAPATAAPVVGSGSTVPRGHCAACQRPYEKCLCSLALSSKK